VSILLVALAVIAVAVRAALAVSLRVVAAGESTLKSKNEGIKKAHVLCNYLMEEN
jgi:hypothetical protein